MIRKWIWTGNQYRPAFAGLSVLGNSMPKIDVYGLSKTHIEQLKKAALIEFGEENVSLMARKIILDQLSIPNEYQIQPDVSASKERMEIRISKKELNTLAQIASNENISSNRYVSLLVKQHIYKHAPLPDAFANALLQSNYQLLRIGRNINQIARQLNVGEEVSITSQNIQALIEIIEKHTKVVGQALLTNRRRFE